MRVRVWSVVLTLVAATTVVGCGGDNLDFCDGCGSPTPTVTQTPTPTPTETPVTSTSPGTATPVPSITRTPFGN